MAGVTSTVPFPAQWGTSQKAGASSYGIVVSYERVDDLMTQNETDEDGAVCRVVEYDVRHRIVVAIVARREADMPPVGTVMSLEGKQGWVQHAEVIEQNRAFKKIRITLDAYKKCDTLG